MTDPLTDIEDRTGQIDLGRMAYRIFSGAQTEGATRFEAALVVYAWLRALLERPSNDPSESENP
jgi:hypothetical protein